MQLPLPPSARRHLRVGGRAAGSPPRCRRHRRRRRSRDSSRGRRASKRASEPNAPGREVSARLNIAACHDRRLFVASEKGINDTPARDSVFLPLISSFSLLSFSLPLPLSLSLSLSLSLFLVRVRAREHGIHYNELFARLAQRPFFKRAELFLSFTSKSARGDALFRCECAGCSRQIVRNDLAS